MLQIDMPNARLVDAVANEPKSDLRGRDYYCHKTLGLPRLSKAYRECKAGERQADKGLSGAEKKAKADERKGGSYVSDAPSGAGDDWVTNDYMDGDDMSRTGNDDWTGDPSSDTKDFGNDNRIMGMEKSVGIPVIAIGSIAILVGTILIIKKVSK